VHRLVSGGGAGGKGIGFEVAFSDLRGEVLLDELFGLEVARGAVETLGSYLEELFSQMIGGLAVEAGSGLGVGRGGSNKYEE
jgi:hypothetical protein